MTCERSALVLSALGVLVIGAILTFDGVTVHDRRLHFRTSAGAWSGGPPGSASSVASRWRRSSADRLERRAARCADANAYEQINVKRT